MLFVVGVDCREIQVAEWPGVSFFNGIFQVAIFVVFIISGDSAGGVVRGSSSDNIFPLVPLSEIIGQDGEIAKCNIPSKLDHSAT